MKLTRKAGATSNILQIFIADSSSSTGAGLTGLVFNSAGLTAYYHKDTDTTATAITLVTMTVGTFTSSGFKEIDATNMPGWYQFCPPDAAFSSGKSVGFHLKGASNMAPLPIEIELVSYDPYDSVRLGLTALPNAAAEAVGGLYTRGTGAGQINQPANGMIDTNMVRILGTAVSTPATAGILDVNVKNMNNVAATSITTINANQGTTQPVNFTGTGASATVKSDTVNIAGAAVSTSTAQIGVNLVNIAGAAVNTASAQLGVNVVSYASGQAPLQPTVAGRTLDVTATGEAGIDWANIGSPTTSVNLSGTTISTSQAVASVSGAVGSVTGNVGGNVTGSVGSVVGNVGGNVVGSVASVTARVTANTDQLAGQTVTAAAGVTFPSSVASPTNITAGTITTVTNLTNAPTNGDFTATMKTSLNASTPASITGAVGSVTGNVGGNVVGSVGSVTGNVGGNVAGSVGSVTGNVGGNVVGTIGGLTAGALADFFTVDSGEIYADAVAGSVVYEIATNAGGSGLTVQQIVDGVWDEPIADHLDSGSTGAALNAAGSAGDPWSTSLPGAYGAGTAGYIIGNNLDAAITSRMASYTQPTGFLAATFPGGTIANTTNITAGTVTTATNVTTVNGLANNVITSASIAAGALNGKGDWNVGKTGYSLSAGGIAGIWDAATSGLVTSGSIGLLLATNIDSAISSRMATYAQPTGFLAATFPAQVASPTNITTVATVTNLTNAPTNGDFTAAMKTSLNASTPASVGAVSGNVAGSVGSVVGNVGGNVVGSVASVVGSVGSVVGNVGGNVTGSVGSVVGNVGGSVASVTARVTANTDQLAGQTITAASGVTFPAVVASPTNITTVATVTNLTNAPTNGDFTATMKSSLNASTPAAITGAVGSVTGNVDGSVGSVVSAVTVGQVNASASNKKKGVAFNDFAFPMYNSINGGEQTGLTVSGFISQDGGAFAPMLGTVVEIGNGWYSINITAGEMNANVLALRFTATGAVTRDIQFITQP